MNWYVKSKCAGCGRELTNRDKSWLNKTGELLGECCDDDTTDRARIEHIHNAAWLVVCDVIEDITGEMSHRQRHQVTSAVMTFWGVIEDLQHPRADGRRWNDVMRDIAARGAGKKP